ncbi:ABC transporter I family member 17, partial [Bienertia sinuspersici]
MDEVTEHLLVNIDDGVVVNESGKNNNKSNGEENLRKVSDKGVCILDGVDLDIPKGMIVGIIGPSGSGKSTLLRALNRLWEPPADSVFLDGRDVCDLDVLSVRRRVAMLFQLPALFQ